MSDNIYLVYKHTSPSGKSYIGVTNDYPKRCNEHQQSQGYCRLFYKAIKKYGWDNFLHEILYDNLSLDQANWREQQSINEYGSLAPSGYNLLPGGNCREQHPETRELIRQSSIGRALGLKYWNDGVTTKRARECPGDGWLHGRLLSDKTKQSLARKISNRTQGFCWWNNGTNQVFAIKAPDKTWKRGMLVSHKEKMSSVTSGRHAGTKWWNNGVVMKRCKDQPGPEWVLGKV